MNDQRKEPSFWKKKEKLFGKLIRSFSFNMEGAGINSISHLMFVLYYVEVERLMVYLSLEGPYRYLHSVDIGKLSCKLS